MARSELAPAYLVIHAGPVYPDASLLNCGAGSRAAEALSM